MSTKKEKTDRNNNGRRTSPSNVRHIYWKWSENGKPDPKILANLVGRIVRAAKPEKIVLFGSAARNEMGPDSDYDLLVVKGGKYNHSRVLRSIYEHLSGKDAPVDVVLVTPEDVERYRHTHCLVICPALKEGKTVYEAQASAAGRSPRVAKSSSQQPRLRKGARPRSVP